MGTATFLWQQLGTVTFPRSNQATKDDGNQGQSHYGTSPWDSHYANVQGQPPPQDLTIRTATTL